MKKESGVSSVVGVVLLLSLVIVTASILGFVLSSATYNAVDSTPNVIFTTSEDPSMLYNGGGDILYKDKLEFYAGGYNVNSYISIDDSLDWTEWHTGQAITISYDGYSVSDLAIVALDSRGNGYLVYDGPTADPIPSGNPVPDVTPVPTPAPVKPDASFTLTSVDHGENVSMGILPSSLANTKDHFVVMGMEWIDSYWVYGWHYNDWGWWVYGWYQVPGYWEKYTDVEFTAVETEGVTYSWSSTGPDSQVDDSASNPAYVRFNTSGDYTIMLEVTNTTSGLSNSSTQTVSVRNPGITVLAWILRDGSGTGWNSPYFQVDNRSSSWSTDYKWQLMVDRNGNNEYNLEFKIGLYEDDVTSSQTISLNRWYHVVGTFEQTEGDNYLNLYVNGQHKDHKPTSDSPAENKGRYISVDKKYFEYDPPLLYEIPFAMTKTEIQDVYNVEINLPKS